MNIFFRPNASVNEKIYTVTIMCLSVVMIYGLLQGFSPNSETIKYACYTAIPLCIFMAAPLILDRHPNNRIHSAGLLSKIVAYPLILLFSYGLTLAFIVISAPAIYTKFLGTDTTASFQILSKSSGTWKKLCTYSFQVKEVDSEFTAKFCTTPEVWQSLNEGDTAKGNLRYSVFGKIVWHLEP